MKYLAKSAEVLSEADRFQAMLDWQLFVMDQDRMLWTDEHFVVTWRPGEPLYPDPRSIVEIETYDWCDCSNCVEGREHQTLAHSNYEGNCVRNMIDLFDDGEAYRQMRCQDCLVSWQDGDECWMCGKLYPKKFSEFKAPSWAAIGRMSRITEDQNGLRISFVINDEEWNRAIREQFEIYMQGFSRGMIVAGQRAGRAMRGMSSMMQTIDEWLPTEGRFFLNDPQEAYSVARCNPPAPPRNPLERGDVEITLVDPVVPILPEWSAYNRPRLELPPNWAELRAPVPMPNMPEPRVFTPEDGRPLMYQTPITERRRRG